METQSKKAFIVYRSGPPTDNPIATVFEVDCFNLADYGRNANQILIAEYFAAEMFCHGLEYAGYTIRAASCERRGDISRDTWSPVGEFTFIDQTSYPSDWLL